jgi:hypothetical protein
MFWNTWLQFNPHIVEFWRPKILTLLNLLLLYISAAHPPLYANVLCLTKYHAMKSYPLLNQTPCHTRCIVGVEVLLHSFLTSSLDGGKWSPSHPSHFNLGIKVLSPIISICSGISCKATSVCLLIVILIHSPVQRKAVWSYTVSQRFSWTNKIIWCCKMKPC